MRTANPDQGRTKFLVPGNQEITRPTRTRKKKNPQGNHPTPAGTWVFFDLWCSGEAKEKKNIT
jgi:hypothetical protein